MVAYSVDLEMLDGFITQMSVFDTAVEQQVAVLDRVMAQLHSVWVGAAATEQKAAHASLMQGLSEMRRGLAEMQAAAQHAHGNYSAAFKANSSMFGQVG
jgi:WXG100 family type VII secretion target